MPYESPNIVIVPTKSFLFNDKNVPLRKIEAQKDKTASSSERVVPNSTVPQINPNITSPEVKLKTCEGASEPLNVYNNAIKCANLGNSKNKTQETMSKSSEVYKSPAQSENVSKSPGLSENVSNIPGQIENVSKSPGLSENVSNIPGQIENVTKSTKNWKDAKKSSPSWASGYLQSIGQCAKTIKQLNFSYKNKFENMKESTPKTICDQPKIKRISASKIAEKKSLSPQLQTSPSTSTTEIGKDVKTNTFQTQVITNTVHDPNKNFYKNLTSSTKNVRKCNQINPLLPTPLTSSIPNMDPRHTKDLYHNINHYSNEIIFNNKMDYNVQNAQVSTHNTMIAPYYNPGTSLMPPTDMLTPITRYISPAEISLPHQGTTYPNTNHSFNDTNNINFYLQSDSVSTRKTVPPNFDSNANLAPSVETVSCLTPISHMNNNYIPNYIQQEREFSYTTQNAYYNTATGEIGPPMDTVTWLTQMSNLNTGHQPYHYINTCMTCETGSHANVLIGGDLRRSAYNGVAQNACNNNNFLNYPQPPSVDMTLASLNNTCVTPTNIEKSTAYIDKKILTGESITGKKPTVLTARSSYYNNNKIEVSDKHFHKEKREEYLKLNRKKSTSLSNSTKAKELVYKKKIVSSDKSKPEIKDNTLNKTDLKIKKIVGLNKPKLEIRANKFNKTDLKIKKNVGLDKSKPEIRDKLHKLDLKNKKNVGLDKPKPEIRDNECMKKDLKINMNAGLDKSKPEIRDDIRLEIKKALRKRDSKINKLTSDQATDLSTSKKDKSELLIHSARKLKVDKNKVVTTKSGRITKIKRKECKNVHKNKTNVHGDKANATLKTIRYSPEPTRKRRVRDKSNDVTDVISEITLNNSSEHTRKIYLQNSVPNQAEPTIQSQNTLANHSADRSQKKRVCCDSSRRHESPAKKRIRYSTDSSQNENVSSVKNYVHHAEKFQVKHPWIRAPGSDTSNNEQEPNFDLRSKLSRKNNKHVPKINQTIYNAPDKFIIEKPPEDLKRTVNRNYVELNNKASSPQLLDSKSKNKKYKEIKVIIKIVCPNQEDSSNGSSSDDSNSGNFVDEETRNLDFSFLDDFNIDEIVNSLKQSPKLDNTQQCSRQTYITDDMQNGKDVAKSPTKEFVQPIIIKSEIITEQLEAELKADVIHDDTNCESSKEKVKENTYCNISHPGLSNCKYTLCKPRRNSTTKIDVNTEAENEAILTHIKQEHVDEIELQKTEITESSTLDNDGHQTVTQLLSSKFVNCESCIYNLYPVDEAMIDMKTDRNKNKNMNLKTYLESFSAIDTEVVLEPKGNKISNNLINTKIDSLEANIICESAISENNNTSLKTYLESFSVTDMEVVSEAKTEYLDSNIVCESVKTVNTLEENSNESKKGYNNKIDIIKSNAKDDVHVTEKIELNVKEEPTEPHYEENLISIPVVIPEHTTCVNPSENTTEIKPIIEAAKETAEFKSTVKSGENTAETLNKLLVKPVEPATDIKNTKMSNNSETQTIPLSKPNKNLASKIEERVFGYLHQKLSVSSLIHQGRFSKIFKCIDRSGRNYAVKVSIHESNNRFLAIIKDKMIKKIQPEVPKDNLNTVYFINCFALDTKWCFLMDYYPKNLEQVLGEKCFHIDETQALGRQLVSAVMMLRNNNVVHSDIKPSHILLDASYKKLKLCGFDASYYGDYENLVPNIGSASYRAPEIILGYSVGFTIDVWSTALVMYEIATGFKLIQGIYNNDILYKQMSLMGDLPMDMVYQSVFGRNHFTGTAFRRRVGHKGQSAYFIQNFYKTGQLRHHLWANYYKVWGPLRSKWQIPQDLAKLTSFHKVLEKMLILDPRQRLTIECVNVHPFIYKMS